MPERLTAEQQRFYREQGHLLYDQPVFSQERFDALKAHVEEQLVIWKAAMNPEVVDRTHFIDPVLNDWLLADEVLDLVEPIIGPDIALFASSFINKGPSIGTKTVPWHGDAVFWTPLAEQITAITVWLAIDPANIENGCMMVIPGTHRNREIEHVASTTGLDEKIFHREVNPELINESEAVDCILESNHCSLHDAYLIHGSHAGGDARRVGFQMRYMPTTVKGTDYLGQQIYLARGRDHAGNDYGDPTRVNERWLAAHPEQRDLVVD